MSGEGASVELDFFGIEKGTSKSQFQKLIQQRSVSKINPQILKTVINSGSPVATSDGTSPENNESKSKVNHQNGLPVFNHVFRAPSSESSTPGTTTTSPFTIFYNGTVSVFEIPHDKAEMIMKLAEEGNTKVVESIDMKLIPSSSSSNAPKILEKLNGDLPIARKKSLQRFLEKRKERLATAAPYANGGGSESGMEKKQEN